jgi:hypothetical protein
MSQFTLYGVPATPMFAPLTNMHGATAAADRFYDAGVTPFMDGLL